MDNSTNPILLTLQKILVENSIPVIPLDHIKLERKLMKGGQGSVFKATQLLETPQGNITRPVAVKKIQVTYDNVLNTLRELKFLATGKALCVSLVTMYGIILELEPESEMINCSIVMELMHRSLQDYIYTSHEAKPFKEKLRILQQIAVCLEFLHVNDIVHRDIKPQNILLDDCNNVCVTDLGFSRLMAKDTEMMITQCFSGSPRYTSPEQFLENKYNCKSDMWSFGIVAYEVMKFNKKTQLMLETPPWEGKVFSYKQVLDKVSPLQELWQTKIENQSIIKLIEETVTYSVDDRLSSEQAKKLLTPMLWRQSTT